MSNIVTVTEPGVRRASPGEGRRARAGPMYVCVYTYIYIYIYIYVYVGIYIYIYYGGISASAWPDIRSPNFGAKAAVRTVGGEYIYIYIYICTHIHIYIYILCVIYIYIYIYIYNTYIYSGLRGGSARPPRRPSL